MKFRFCGDGDCPDWVLAEIHSNLSILSSVKLRILTQSVAKSILGEEMNEEKIKEMFSTTSNSKESSKSAIACLRFILTSASRHNTDNAVLSAELQQLGLPKEHSTAICRVLSDTFSDIQNYLMKNILKVNELEKITWKIPDECIDCGQFNFYVKNELVNGIEKNVVHTVNIHKTDIQILLNELKIIRGIMEKYDDDKKFDRK